MGSIIRERDPNYALLSKATQTIQRFLDIISNDDVAGSPFPTSSEALLPVDDSFGFLNPDPWNLEIGFWNNLGEHSLFSNVDPALGDGQ